MTVLLIVDFIKYQKYKLNSLLLIGFKPNPAFQRQSLPLLQRLLFPALILGFTQNSKQKLL
ncbi:hypothetical protein CMU35_08685 [Elizabethkingia anophelis]|nr:hypothetical protein [Elizabethkingia anophelis]